MTRVQRLRRSRWPAVFFLLTLVTGASCLTNNLGPDPQVTTLYLLFPGNDTVFVDVESGNVTSGPISIFGSVDFSAEFFANDGTPDMRVTEQKFRLDVTPVNQSVVTFTRITPFTGTLNKIGTGTTNITFVLKNIETDVNLFSLLVPIESN